MEVELDQIDREEDRVSESIKDNPDDVEAATQFFLIDLSNDLFIVWFTQRSDYDIVLLNEPWMIGDHYLHVQR